MKNEMLIDDVLNINMSEISNVVFTRIKKTRTSQILNTETKNWVTGCESDRDDADNDMGCGSDSKWGS
jgi:hypothetical protein